MSKEREDLDRLKRTIQEYSRWLSPEFPDVVLVLDNLLTVAEGKESLCANYPPSERGPWSTKSLREVLRVRKSQRCPDGGVSVNHAMTRPTTEQHNTLAAIIGRREWGLVWTNIERATLVLDDCGRVGIDAANVTPAQLSVAMSCMPLNGQDICNYADMACALAAVLPRAKS